MCFGPLSVGEEELTVLAFRAARLLEHIVGVSNRGCKHTSLPEFCHKTERAVNGFL